jgi:hypothetical protein
MAKTTEIRQNGRTFACYMKYTAWLIAVLALVAGMIGGFYKVSSKVDANEIKIDFTKEYLTDEIQEVEEAVDRVDMRQEKMDTKLDGLKETLDKLAAPK